MPPDRGNIVPSSAYDKAPKRDRTPPMTQRARISTGLPISPAISRGTLKIPLPTMIPTMIAEPPQKPILLGRSFGSAMEETLNTKARRTQRSEEWNPRPGFSTIIRNKDDLYRFNSRRQGN